LAPLALSTAALAACPPLPGDTNQDLALTVSDVQCTVLAALWELSGMPAAPPQCLGGQSGAADVDCSGNTSVVDAQLTIRLVLGLGLDPALDFDQDNCPNACEDNAFAPDAPDLAASLHWREALLGASFDLLADVSDPDGPMLALVDAGPAEVGQVTPQLPTGTAEYRTAEPWKGTDAFSYTVTDSQFTDTAQVSVEVWNTAPIAEPDSVVLHWREAAAGFSIPVLANDFDADPLDPQEHLSISYLSAPPEGEITAGPDFISITPEPKFVGQLYLLYGVTDGLDESITSVDVYSYNNEPIIAPAALSVHWRDAMAGVNVPLLSYCSDPDILDIPFLKLEWISPTSLGPSFSTAKLHVEDATYTTLVPTVGADSFVFSVRDGLFPAYGTVDIALQNEAPLALPDVFAVPRGASAELPLLHNDTDHDVQDNPHLTIAEVIAEPAGSVVVAQSGRSVLWSPTPGAEDGITFSYAVSDGLALTWSTATVDIVPASAAPRATDLAAIAFGTTPIEVQVLRGAKWPHWELSVEVLAPPTGGTLEVSGDTTVTYAALPGHSGADEAMLTLRAESVEAPGFVVRSDFRLTVDTVSHPPVAVDDFATTPAGVPTLVDVLRNDLDPDGEALWLVAAPKPPCAKVQLTGGKLMLTPEPKLENGVCELQYTISDGFHLASASVYLTVFNHAPQGLPLTVARGAGASTLVAPNTLAHDPDGQALEILSAEVTDGSAGVQLTDAGLEVTAGQEGESTVAVEVSDGFESVWALVTVLDLGNEAPVKSEPAAAPDSVVVAPDVAREVDVAANDWLPGDGDLAVEPTTPPKSGTVSAAPKSGALVYAALGPHGTLDAFEYAAMSGGVVCHSWVEVLIQNAAPRASHDREVVLAGAESTLDPTLNDLDLDGHGLSWWTSDDSAEAADTTAPGAESVTVSDGHAEAKSTRHTTWLDLPPHGAPDVVAVQPGANVAVDVLANDRTADAESLFVTSVTPPAGGKAWVGPKGAHIVVSTPLAPTEYPAKLQYTLSDGKTTVTVPVTLVR
jgi:hypothetical protein